MPVIPKSADYPRTSWLHAAKRLLHFLHFIVYRITITGFRKLNFSNSAFWANLRYYRRPYGVSLSHSCHCSATNTATQSCPSFSLSVAWQWWLRYASRERFPSLQQTTHRQTSCAHRSPDRSLIFMGENKLN